MRMLHHGFLYDTSSTCHCTTISGVYWGIELNIYSSRFSVPSLFFICPALKLMFEVRLCSPLPCPWYQTTTVHKELFYERNSFLFFTTILNLKNEKSGKEKTAWSGCKIPSFLSFCDLSWVHHCFSSAILETHDLPFSIRTMGRSKHNDAEDRKRRCCRFTWDL